MGLPDPVTTVLAVVAAVAAVVLGILVAVLWTRLGRMRRAYRAVFEPRGQDDLFAYLERQRDDVEGLRKDLLTVHDNTEMLRELQRTTVSRVAVVRYDAFEDMGGALSFSAALLDEHGNGMVVSAINGRSETRTYAKPVAASTSRYNLSDEEEQAIADAVNSSPGSAGPPPRKSRRRAS